MIDKEKYDDRLYYGLLAGEFDHSDLKLELKGANRILLENYKLHDIDFLIVRDDLYPQFGGGKIP